MVRGEIWLAYLPMTNNSVQGGDKPRPVILYSNNISLVYSPVAHIIPLTSQRKNNLPVHVDVGTNCGLLKPSTALCEQLMPIAKTDLIRKVGQCDFETMNKINNSTMIQFGLVEAYSQCSVA